MSSRAPAGGPETIEDVLARYLGELADELGIPAEFMRPRNRAVDATASSITCPRCFRTSYNRHDIAQGYCGNCHAFTWVM